jgi:hypothetical protein
MNEVVVEWHGRKIKWVEVCCADCENCIFNDDEYSEIFPLKCKISNIKMDFDTAFKKRKIACDSYKPIASS